MTLQRRPTHVLIDTFFPTFKENSISRVFDDMDRLFRESFPDFFVKHGVDGRILGGGFPRTNVYVDKDNKHLFVKSEIYGWKKENISVKLNKEDGLLTVSGKTKPDEGADECIYLLRELKYSSFERKYPLNPELINFDTYKASFKDGLLLIEFELLIKETPQPEIEIKL